MIEMAFEYTLSVIDYTYLLFFYLKLINKKWVWKKAVIEILLISLLQLFKDYTLVYSAYSLAIDCAFVTLFLFLCSEKYNVNNFLYALMIYGIFDFATIFFVSCAIELDVNINSTLVFGVNRLIFCIFIKTFTILIYISVFGSLQKLHVVMKDKVENAMLLSMSMILITFAFILEKSKENDRIIFYTLLLSTIMISVLYLFYRYCKLLKEQADSKIIQHSIDITSEYVKSLEKEHEEIRKIRHDIMNQLTALEYLIEQKDFDEVKHLLYKLNESIDVNKVSISGNVYIDAVLRQKIIEYEHITFDTDIKVTKDFMLEGSDLISLLSNIIDNACEELERISKNVFQLTIRGNTTQLIIKETNECRTHVNMKTDKNKKLHGYGLKIIEEIVHKYNGEINYGTENSLFKMSILILIE